MSWPLKLQSVSRQSSEKKQPWLAMAVVGITLTIMIGLVTMFGLDGWPDWTGLGAGQSIFTITQRDAVGNITQTFETATPQPAKTFWDWLSLLGVPLSLAVLGYWLQQQQQKRANIDSQQQREMSARQSREEALQAYFDRLATLLIDKNLLAIATKVYTANETPKATAEQQDLLDTALDVIRAQTLSILRRCETDGDRKSSVIRFLIEAEVISKAKLSLRDADLREANLRGINLREADLRDVDLRHANLSGAVLRNAVLGGADLTSVNLRHADLRHADLNNADLIDADLRNTDLRGANLSYANVNYANLTGAILDNAVLYEADLMDAELMDANLSSAVLCRTQLPGDIAIDANRDCKTLGLDTMQ